MKIKISIIIPVYNDAKGLRKTLSSLIKQDYPKENYEIIIADNNSNDITASITKQIGFVDSNLIKVVYEREKQSSYAARNKGIKYSEGEILCFIDSDMVVPENYLNKIQSKYCDHSIKYSGCNVNLINKKNTIISKYNQYFGFPIKSYIKKKCFVPTCCLTLRRNLIREIGMFDDRLVSGGDLEFGRRVHDSGIKQNIFEDIDLYHPTRYKYKQLVKKAIRVNKGIAQLCWYHKQQFEHLYESQFEINQFSPQNPWKTKYRFNQAGIELSTVEAIIGSILFFNLNIIGFVSLIKEYQKLKGIKAN